MIKKINETRNYLLDEIKYFELMNEKHKKVCRVLNYFEHFLIFVSIVIGFVSVSVFASLFGVLVGIASSVLGLKKIVLIAGIRKYKSFIKKKKKHD